MLTESTGSMKPVAVIIVGSDALLAAQPATPIQLWHACLAAGYDLAVPATWGDELIAAECLRALVSHPAQVAVLCSCPLVARMLGDMPGDVSEHLVSIVAPPVAAAKYLRRVYGDRRVHVTYAGACPAAADSAIDSWIAPSELLDRFRANEIELEAQPELFESVLPPDRRRHLSLPGGLPAAEQAAMIARPRRVHQIDDADLIAALQRQLASGVRALVDMAPRAGCACSGALPDVPPSEARAAVAALEPPRSARPVMADPGGLGLSRRLQVRPPAAGDQALSGTGAPSQPSGGKPTRDRSVTLAVRAASRSPLSWHLRERAMPQPPTTGHADTRRPPENVRTTGASSAGWGLPSADRNPPAAETPDPVTAAAVRALEKAASVARPTEVPKDAAIQPAASSPAPRVSAPTEQATAIPMRRSSSVPEARPESNVPVEARVPRTTPAGGYWFAAPAVTGADSEIRRPSTPVDAVPADVAPSREADTRDAGTATAPGAAGAVGHDLLPSTSEEQPEDQPPPPASGPDASVAAAIEPVIGQPPRVESEDAASEVRESAPDQGTESDEGENKATSADTGPIEAAMTGAPECLAGGAVIAESDSVRAELSELFRRNEALATVAPKASPSFLSAGIEVRAIAGGPADDSVAEPASGASGAATPPATGRSGPLPWKWLFGALLLMVAAITLARHINARVTSEDGGTSALMGSVGPTPRIPADAGVSGADSTSAPVVESGGPGSPSQSDSLASGLPVTQTPGAPPRRPTSRRARQARGSPDAGSVSPGRSATRTAPGAQRDGAVTSLPVPAAAESAGISGGRVPPLAGTAPLSARDAELQAIRDEIARRSARLDSMGRTIDSLYIPPRIPTSARPPAPPPSAPPPAR